MLQVECLQATLQSLRPLSHTSKTPSAKQPLPPINKQSSPDAKTLKVCALHTQCYNN